MELADLQQRLLEAYGIRVEPEMGRYVIRRLAAGEKGKLPVIGGNAKTGAPVRTLIDPATLTKAPSPQPSLFPQ